MTDARIQKARAAAAKAAEEVAKLEAQEAERAAQEAAERGAKQRDLDTAFLAQWEALDTELLEIGSESTAKAVYSGADPVPSIAAFWIARRKRNVIRERAREAYVRVHGKQPEPGFALELTARSIDLVAALTQAIHGAIGMHAADLADELDAKWMVSDGS
ncbi:hypothetical protein NC315_08750 [Streptomyces sp. G2]|uniref:hypothetical protein n=1 Tax=Streptomyces sp. G2 TaxID=1684471 RepID=UPI00202E5D3A|nr:hypothetical protein [Streptomyces sp. G2]MCM1945462.1 hypothetical protein [Streptomyces sp. G2]